MVREWLEGTLRGRERPLVVGVGGSGRLLPHFDRLMLVDAHWRT